MNDEAIVTSARLSALQNQRNAALNESVALAGQVVLYQAKIKELQAEVERLKKRKAKNSSENSTVTPK